MSGVSTFNIGGLASGLDTNNILSQLLQIERTPILQLQNRQAKLAKVDDAWSLINTKLSSFRSAVDGLKTATKFASFASATSSNLEVLTVQTTGTAPPGSVQLTVEKLAFSTQRASGAAEGFASLDATMGTRQLTIHQGGTDYVVNPVSTDTTLSEYVTQINASGAPVRAQAVRVDDGSYRLVLTAKESGVANDFTLTATNWSGAFDTLQAGQDAEVRIGDPVTGLLVKRSSNTVTDLIDGVTIRLRTVSATPVTVTTARNADGAIAAVKRLVDEANATLDTVRNLSKYDADKNKAQPLAGDSTARRITVDVLSTVSRLIVGADGDYTSAGSLGITLTSDGKLALDESVLRTALTDNWDQVANAIGRNGRATDARALFLAASDRTVAGTYAITVTQAAETATVTGGAYAASAQTLTIVSDGVTANVVTDGTESLAQLITKINTQLSTDGITTVRAEDDGGALKLSDTRYGTAYTFTVSSDGDSYGTAGTYAGEDVIATIGSETVTGKGQIWTSTTGDTEGLSVRLQATAAEVAGAGGSLALGDVTAVQGVAGQLSSVIKRFEGAIGDIQISRDRVKSTIDLYQERIDRLEIRIKQREITLRRQFTAMETAMNALIQQGNRISGALAGLSGGQQRR